MMNKKVIAFSAWINGACYLIGFLMLYSIFLPCYTSDWSLNQQVEFILAHQRSYQLWNLIVYLLFGLSLIVLVTSLARKLNGMLFIQQITLTVGLIWAGFVIAAGMIANVGLETVAKLYFDKPEAAINLWLVITTLQDALGGGVEIIGGLWMLLVTWQARSLQYFNNVINLLGMLSGLAGIISIIPLFDNVVVLFGLGQLIWFVLIGFWVVTFDKTKVYMSCFIK